MSILFVSILTSCFSVSDIYADNLDYNVTVKPSLKLTVSSNNLVLNLNPANHTFDSIDLNTNVATNNTNGYKLYIDASTTDLVNTTDSSYKIPNLPSTESGYDTTTFPANYWGYKLGTTNFFPFESGALVSQSATYTNGTASTITFGAKIDYEKPAGQYNIALNFQALPQVTQYYMQDLLSTPGLAASVCNEQGPSIVLDKRDEQAYMIQRLPDHKCWMLDNLNLDLTNADIVAGLTTDNTNADVASLKSLREGNRTDCGEADCSRYATSGLTLENWTTGGSLSVPLINKSGVCSTANTGPCSYNGQYTNNIILSTLTPSQSVFGLGSGKIGIYYNYCAASAGSYCYSDSGSSDAYYDVCPANWRLPTGGPSGEFKSLCNSIKDDVCSDIESDMDASSSNSLQYQLSTSLTGRYRNDGRAQSQGKYGIFMSSTYSADGSMFRLTAFPTEVQFHATNARSMSGSIRCILKDSAS